MPPNRFQPPHALTFYQAFNIRQTDPLPNIDTISDPQYFDTRFQTDEFLDQNSDYSELLGETTGPNLVAIYAGAVDPSVADYEVYYPSWAGRPVIDQTLTSWQEVAINTLFHEEFHASGWSYGESDFRNEYEAREFSLQHMAPGGYP